MDADSMGMDLEIQEIKNDGGSEKERVLILALNDCNTENYILFDTTYTDDGEVSNELRHSFFFPDLEIQEGEIVVVYTKKGTYKRHVSSIGTVYHRLFWGLEDAIWNDEEDWALLVKVSGCSTKHVGE